MGRIATYFYVLGTMMAKFSLLLFMYRIFKVNVEFRIVSWILGVILVIWSITTFLLQMFSCRPIRAAWDLHLFLDPRTRCSPNAYDFLVAHGFCNIITDFGLLLLPIPMIWGLQMTTKKRLGIGAVFATGAL